MSVTIPSHSSHIGRKWQTYWSKRNRNGHDALLLPKIDIAIKIYEVADLDEKSGRFNAVFTLMLDWLDPSLERNNKTELQLSEEIIDWSLHFVPRVELIDCIADSQSTQLSLPRVRAKDHTGECNHCTMTLKYSVTLKSRFDFRRFPFETQILHFSIKTCSISDGIQFANGHHHARRFNLLLDPNTTAIEHELIYSFSH